jgi:hypothetical protein
MNVGRLALHFAAHENNRTIMIGAEASAGENRSENELRDPPLHQ